MRFRDLDFGHADLRAQRGSRGANRSPCVAAITITRWPGRQDSTSSNPTFAAALALNRRAEATSARSPLVSVLNTCCASGNAMTDRGDPAPLTCVAQPGHGHLSAVEALERLDIASHEL